MLKLKVARTRGGLCGRLCDGPWQAKAREEVMVLHPPAMSDAEAHGTSAGSVTRFCFCSTSAFGVGLPICLPFPFSLLASALSLSLLPPPELPSLSPLFLWTFPTAIHCSLFLIPERKRHGFGQISSESSLVTLDVACGLINWNEAAQLPQW